MTRSLVSSLALLCMVQAGLSMHAVEYLPGSPGSSLVISAPHDGEMKPASIPTRQNGCQTESGGCDFKPSCTGKRSIACRATSVQDLYTKDIARELQATIGRLTGLMPHLIVSHLARSKLDPNRPVEEAAQYNPAAIRAWTDFHGYIQTAHTAVQSNGPGLHIDIHGQNAEDNWIEFGYGISRSQLNKAGRPGHPISFERSSIKALARRLTDTRMSEYARSQGLQKLLSGTYSMGAMAEARGFKSVPSPQFQRPNMSNPGKYYSGGYITKRWGSRNGGDIDSIQFELPMDVRKNFKTSGPQLGEVVVEFMERHYKLNTNATVFYSSDSSEDNWFEQSINQDT